jgi:hypothetical protein
MPDPWAAFAERDFARRATAYGLAGLLHALFFAFLIALSPSVRETVGNAVGAIDVRLYTIAGGPGADTDAPLFEPPLSADNEAETGAEGIDGGENGDEGVSAGTNNSVIETEPDIVEAPDIIETPEPVDLPEVELSEPVEDRLVDDDPSDPDAVLLRENALEELAEDIPTTTTRPRSSPPPPSSASAANDAPLETTQVRVPERNEAPVRLFTFGEILARTQTALDPGDFEYIEMLGGARETLADFFCLSSASGNRDALNCPDTPSPESVELAQYGLMGLGEEMPVFMEDMDRLAFELQQLGADSSAVDRIMTAIGAARREAIATDPLLRSMQRDAGAQVDNLGSSLNSVMPDNARDPSGEN